MEWVIAVRSGRLPLQPHFATRTADHVKIGRPHQSVLYRLAHEPIVARITARMIELSRQGEPIAAQMRDSGAGRHTTTLEHMPSSHRWLPTGPSSV